MKSPFVTTLRLIGIPGALLLSLIARTPVATATQAGQCAHGGWNLVASPNPNTGNELNAVAAISVNNVWAVGDGDLIEHWDGSSWQVVSSPNVPSTDDFLYGVGVVPGSHHAWAVGFSEPAHSGGTTQIEPLIEYYC